MYSPIHVSQELSQKIESESFVSFEIKDKSSCDSKLYSTDGIEDSMELASMLSQLSFSKDSEEIENVLNVTPSNSCSLRSSNSKKISMKGRVLVSKGQFPSRKGIERVSKPAICQEGLLINI